MKILKDVFCHHFAWSIPLFLLAMTSASDSNKEQDFTAGQEWSIKCTPPTTAKVVIGRVEPWMNKIAVHVSIVDLPLSLETGAFQISQIAHAPFEKSALAASVDKLVATGVAPSQDFEAGYRQWKEHNGGIYTVSVAQALGLGQSILNGTRQ
jgi:hypothetical protein